MSQVNGSLVLNKTMPLLDLTEASEAESNRGWMIRRITKQYCTRSSIVGQPDNIESKCSTDAELDLRDTGRDFVTMAQQPRNRQSLITDYF